MTTQNSSSWSIDIETEEYSFQISFNASIKSWQYRSMYSFCFGFYLNTRKLLQECFPKCGSTQRQVAIQLSHTEMAPGITRDTITSCALPLLAPSSVTHQDTPAFYPSSPATCLLAPTALLFSSYTTAFPPSRPQANKKAPVSQRRRLYTFLL